LESSFVSLSCETVHLDTGRSRHPFIPEKSIG
jgi:hypothetical protein